VCESAVRVAAGTIGVGGLIRCSLVWLLAFMLDILICALCGPFYYVIPGEIAQFGRNRVNAC